MCLVVESATDQALSQKMYELFYGYGERMAVNELFVEALQNLIKINHISDTLFLSRISLFLFLSTCCQ